MYSEVASLKPQRMNSFELCFRFLGLSVTKEWESIYGSWSCCLAGFIGRRVQVFEVKSYLNSLEELFEVDV